MTKLGKANALNAIPEFIGNDGYIQRTAEEHQSIIDQTTGNNPALTNELHA